MEAIDEPKHGLSLITNDVLNMVNRWSSNSTFDERTKNKIGTERGYTTMHRNQPKDGHIKIVIKTPIWHNIENQTAKK